MAHYSVGFVQACDAITYYSIGYLHKLGILWGRGGREKGSTSWPHAEDIITIRMADCQGVHTSKAWMRHDFYVTCPCHLSYPHPHYISCRLSTSCHQTICVKICQTNPASSLQLGLHQTHLAQTSPHAIISPRCDRSNLSFRQYCGNISVYDSKLTYKKIL